MVNRFTIGKKKTESGKRWLNRSSTAKNKLLAGKKVSRSREDILEDLARSAVLVSFVDQLKTTMAALLLVLWIPATSLCLLEAAGWISDADGCAAGQSLESSPCCALASASYKMQENRQVAQPSYAVEIALVVE